MINEAKKKVVIQKANMSADKIAIKRKEITKSMGDAVINTYRLPITTPGIELIPTCEWAEKNVFSKIQPIPESEVCEGDIAVYKGQINCDNVQIFGITYAGKITADGTIMGMWGDATMEADGQYGFIITHILDLVPECYGDIKDVRYYREQDADKARGTYFSTLKPKFPKESEWLIRKE